MTQVNRMSDLNCVCTSLFDNVYSHGPGAPYGDQRIGINHMSSTKERLNSEEELTGG